MKYRADVVAFDVIETIFSLESLRPRLEGAGLPGHLLETWFAQLLRDAFALDATGVYEPFHAVATATLKRQFPGPAPADSARIDDIMAGFNELDAHPDAETGMRKLRDCDVRILTLTNGSAKVTEALLERAGLHHFVERTVTIDSVKHWKPRREVYLYCAETAGVDLQHLALVAAHPWDIQGARRAGLLTGYVTRDGRPYPAIMEEPHVVGATLLDVAEGLTAAA